jgi:hypothetical protein
MRAGAAAARGSVDVLRPPSTAAVGDTTSLTLDARRWVSGGDDGVDDSMPRVVDRSTVVVVVVVVVIVVAAEVVASAAVVLVSVPDAARLTFEKRLLSTATGAIAVDVRPGRVTGDVVAAAPTPRDSDGPPCPPPL